MAPGHCAHLLPLWRSVINGLVRFQGSSEACEGLFGLQDGVNERDKEIEIERERGRERERERGKQRAVIPQCLQSVAIIPLSRVLAAPALAAE